MCKKGVTAVCRFTFSSVWSTIFARLDTKHLCYMYKCDIGQKMFDHLAGAVKSILYVLPH